MKKIFIIHGWTYSTKSWEKCVSNLSEYGFEPVILKVPGLTEPSDKVFTLEDYTRWLGEKIGGENDVCLVGHSNGGRVAINYVATVQNNVTRLVLIDSAGIVHNELSLRTRRKVFGFVAKFGKIFVKSDLVRKIYYRLIGASDYEKAPENMRKTMAGLISIDLKPKLSKINIPALIIWGSDDKVTPISDAEIMNKEIKNSKLVVISGAGHSPHMSHPDVVTKNISDWLSNK